MCVKAISFERQDNPSTTPRLTQGYLHPSSSVVLTVLFMLTVFSLLQAESIPDGRQLQLDALALNPDSQVLRDGFFRAHPNLIRLVGIEPRFEMTGLIKKLRNIEILTLQSAGDESVRASFDLSADVSTAALLSLTTTFIATTLLLVLSLLLSSDAYKIIIAPIENMKTTVQRVRLIAHVYYVLDCITKMNLNPFIESSYLRIRFNI